MSDSRLITGLPDFVGRADEIADIHRLLDVRRIVTLVGPPGIGKTRLALEVASRRQDGYPDGAWFIDLAPVQDPAVVPQAVASSLGFDAEPGRDPLEVLCRNLKARTTLLVLDNCEHLIAASAKLAAQVAKECDGVSLLATSQQPLGIENECVEAVPPLSLPALSPTPSIASALESEAVGLFCARAAAVKNGFRLTDEVLPAIGEICHRLDGIPLAIELAATRIEVLGPTEIAERLEQRFRLLTRARASAPARHQTLEAALDWSHDLLADAGAILFRRLSVFVGGASLVAVEDVCGGKGVPRDDMVDLLTALVAKSLLVADTSNARARYRMLETVRAYARTRLEEAQEDRTNLRRHAAWCTTMVERWWHHFAVGDSHVAVGILETEHDNIRAAMQWAVAADPWMGLRLAAAMSPFWKTRGYFKEGRQWLTGMLDATGKGPGRITPTPPQRAVRARALWGLGMLAALQGDAVAARLALEESLQLARDGNLARAEAQALNLLGFISIFLQDPLTAKRLLETSVALARAAGDLSSVGSALALLGRAHVYLGEVAEARAAFDECEKLADDAGHRMSLGLGWTALAAGEERRARQLFEQARPLYTNAGDRFEMALLLGFLGELDWAGGDLVSARANLEDGLELSRAMGAPFPIVRCLCGLASVAEAEGDPQRARTLIDEACEISRTVALPYALVRSLNVRGALKGGDGGASKRDFDEALSTARANSDRTGVALSLYRLGALARATDDDEAMRLLHEALTLQAEIGHAGLPTSMEAIAGTSVALGRHAHAARLFGAGEALRTIHGAQRRPDEIAGYEADVAQLRVALRASEFEKAWAEGVALSRDEAVALALRGRGARESDRPTHGWASLTPTERQVVDLVAEGMTNREIGEKLFISDRTVQSHLTRVFPKLRLKTRREIRESRRLRS